MRSLASKLRTSFPVSLSFPWVLSSQPAIARASLRSRSGFRAASNSLPTREDFRGVWEWGCRMRVRGLQLSQLQEGIWEFKLHKTQFQRGMHTHTPSHAATVALVIIPWVQVTDSSAGGSKGALIRGEAGNLGLEKAMLPLERMFYHIQSRTLCLCIKQVPGRNQGGTGHLH